MTVPWTVAAVLGIVLWVLGLRQIWLFIGRRVLLTVTSYLPCKVIFGPKGAPFLEVR